MKSKFFQHYMKQFDDKPKAFRKSKYIFVYLMVSLAIVNFIVFYVVVNLNSILLAFQEFIGYDENYVEQYVWSLGNFKSMFKEFALPNSTVGRAKSFFYGAASGFVEPVFGILTVLIAGSVVPLMPWMLAFAAGAMLYVVVEELIPEAHLGDYQHVGTFGVMAGFLIMMILDVALG